VRDLVFLVGMMGAGKTTVGERVARHLGWDFVDVDAEVERVTGSSVADLFAAHGEPAFRAEERRAIESLQRLEHPTVVSVGGGAVLDDANCAVMRDGRAVVWLRASPVTLARRVAAGPARPLLAAAGDGAAGADDAGRLAALERLDAQRRARYAGVATATIDVDTLGLDDVVDAVVAAVEVAS
jgi:shikimate kinase